MTLWTLLIMDLHQPFEHLAGSFCVPKVATFPPYLAVKSFQPCLTVFCRVWLYRFSARSPRNLPVFALALSASRCWLTSYLSSHLVTLVLRRFCAIQACSASESALSFAFSDTGAHGEGSFSSLIWMLHASAPWFEWCSTWQLQRCASNPSQSPLFAHSILARTTLPTLGSGVSLVYYWKSAKKSIYSLDFWPIW